MGFTIGQLTAWQMPSIRVGKWASKRGWAGWKPEPFCNLISEMTPYPFYSLEAPHLVQLTLKGRVLHKGMTTGGRTYWESFQKLPTTTWLEFIVVIVIASCVLLTAGASLILLLIFIRSYLVKSVSSSSIYRAENWGLTTHPASHAGRIRNQALVLLTLFRSKNLHFLKHKVVLASGIWHYTLTSPALG